MRRCQLILFLLLPGFLFAGKGWGFPKFTPMTGFDQWKYSAVEIGVSNGIAYGLSGGFGPRGTIHYEYKSVALKYFFSPNTVYAAEIGYWRTLLNDIHSDILNFSLGLHAMYVTDFTRKSFGITLPEPGFIVSIPSLKMHSDNYVSCLFTYRYTFLFGDCHPGGMFPGQISLLLYRKENEDHAGHYD